MKAIVDISYKNRAIVVLLVCHLCGSVILEIIYVRNIKYFVCYNNVI